MDEIMYLFLFLIFSYKQEKTIDLINQKELKTIYLDH